MPRSPRCLGCLFSAFLLRRLRHHATGSRRSAHDVGTWVFAWERLIPFVPLMIVPYMSIDLFFVAAPFLCTDARAAHLRPAHHARDPRRGGVLPRDAAAVLVRAAAGRTECSGWSSTTSARWTSRTTSSRRCTSRCGRSWRTSTRRHTRGVVTDRVERLVQPDRRLDAAGRTSTTSSTSPADSCSAAVCFYCWRCAVALPGGARTAASAAYYLTAAGHVATAARLALARGAASALAGDRVRALSRPATSGWDHPSTESPAAPAAEHARAARAGPPRPMAVAAALRDAGSNAWDRVTDRVWIGRALGLVSARRAAAEGVTAVLDLTGEFAAPPPSEASTTSTCRSST